MSYKLSFQSKNALPSSAANQGQNAAMLFSIANPRSFAGSLFSCVAFSSVQGWRGEELKVHENGLASECMEALCSSGSFEAARRYTSCCTDAYGTKKNKKEVESFFYILYNPHPIREQTKGTVSSCCDKQADDQILKLSYEPQTPST